MAVYPITLLAEDLETGYYLTIKWNTLLPEDLYLGVLNKSSYQKSYIGTISGLFRVPLGENFAGIFKNDGSLLMMYCRPLVNGNPKDNMVIYIDQTGKLTKSVFQTGGIFSVTGLSDTIAPGGLSTLHIDDTRLDQINYGSKSYTSFPVDIPLDPNIKTMSVIGKTFNVQLDNELNIVRVKDGQTEYRQFPATIMVGENKTLQLYGKEDPEITIDYTGTQDPVISNTPATPPPVV